MKDNVKREFGVLQKTFGTSISKGALVEEPNSSALLNFANLWGPRKTHRRYV